jgi:hypothetical protein
VIYPEKTLLKARKARHASRHLRERYRAWQAAVTSARCRSRSMAVLLITALSTR